MGFALLKGSVNALICTVVVAEELHCIWVLWGGFVIVGQVLRLIQLLATPSMSGSSVLRYHLEFDQIHFH